MIFIFSLIHISDRLSFIHSDGTQYFSVHFKIRVRTFFFFNDFIDFCCFYIELMMFSILTQTFLDFFLGFISLFGYLLQSR